MRYTLDSVAAEDYRPVEVIVVDDGSEDGTDEVIDRARTSLAQTGITLRFLPLERNSGPAAARNAGLRLSQGELIAFLASDDLWYPAFLSTLVGLLDRHPTCGVAFSSHVGIDVEGRVIRAATLDLDGGASEGEFHRPIERFVCGFPFITPGTLVRRSVLDEVGWFDETLASWEDADLWYRIAERFDFAYIAEPLASHRLHEGLTSRRLDWYGYQLLVRLRHLGKVRQRSARKCAIEEIQRTQILLQEQLLREGSSNSRWEELLDNEFAPGSLRYRAGRMVRRGPTPLRRPYTAAIRLVGNSRRTSASLIHAGAALLR